MNDDYLSPFLSAYDHYLETKKWGTVTTRRIDDGDIKSLRKENEELKNKLNKLQEDYNELLEEMREC